MATSKPSVLFLIPTFGRGGAERQLGYLALALKRLGLEVHVGYVKGGPGLRRIVEGDIQNHRLGELGNHDARLAWRVIRLIRTVRPNVVQTWLTQMDILGGAAALWQGIPFLLTERTSAEFYSQGVKNRIRVALGRRAAAVVANSNGGLEYWKSAGSSGSQIQRVIPNSIPFDEIDEAGPIDVGEVAEVPFDHLVLFAGRMIAIKNVDTLIAAFAMVLNWRRDAVGVLIGDGPLSGTVVETIRRAELSARLRVLPFSDRIFAWLKRASLFVSVSSFEGNPNTVLEAAACGCPLVVSDISAHREFLDDGSARFVRGQSAEDVAAGIVDTLENREAARARAEVARQRVANRTALAVAEQYLDLYREVCNKERVVSS